MGQLLKVPSGENESTGRGLPVVRDQNKPTVRDQDDYKQRIERLAEVGATPEDIAAELQIPLKRLQKRSAASSSAARAIALHATCLVV